MKLSERYCPNCSMRLSYGMLSIDSGVLLHECGWVGRLRESYSLIQIRKLKLEEINGI